MKPNLKRLVPHILVIIGFVICSLAYFSPVLSGKMLFQNDIKQYEGMARQQNEFKKNTGKETYWNNSAYGGMPTYAIGARFPHDYMDSLDRAIRFLPRPADYLFLYLVSFYILMLVMRIPWKFAVIGALAFGFSTYLIIIIGVGHNAKAHAIAYFPLVLAGIVMVFQKRYVWGFLLTTIAMGLEIQANHYQMTYYLGILVAIVGIAYFIDAFQKKILPHYFTSLGVLVVAVGIGVALNATTLLATAEYAKTSIRGKNYLAGGVTDSAVKDGLDYEYITTYSYGKLESLNLFIPKLMGVGRASDLGKDSALYQKLIGMGYPPEQVNYYTQITRLYWGDQPFVEAPPYLGITVVFLGLLGLLLVKGRLRWWLIGGMVMSLLLSWGKNLDFLSRFFVDYVPLYNKFRAVSSIQVLLELVLPIAAVFGLYQFFNGKVSTKERQKSFLITLGVFGGLCLIFWILGGSIFDFKSASDVQVAIEQPEIFEAIKQDRITVMKSDALRSLIFVLFLSCALWLFTRNKISENIALVAIGLLIVIDLVGVDRRSVDEKGFITKRTYSSNFLPTEADKKIQKDPSYYRVLDQARGFMNSHTNSFFNAIGGYSVVRPRKMDDIYTRYIAQPNLGVMNMLNVKYIILQNEEGALEVQQNPAANGAAWYVDNLKFVEGHKAEFEALKDLDTKNTAVIRNAFASELASLNPVKDSIATIAVSKTAPNYLAYNAYTPADAFVVFSETYYEHGWKAFIDGEETVIYPVNYMLRGLKVPKGKHSIEFRFEPSLVQTGSMITLTSSIVVVLLILGALFFEYKRNEEVDVGQKSEKES